ncbi:MAG: hypothetical protein WC679_05955 [Bacteroidales bacterium]|jgi:hypothetical protein
MLTMHGAIIIIYYIELMHNKKALLNVNYLEELLFIYNLRTINSPYQIESNYKKLKLDYKKIEFDSNFLASNSN